MYELLNNSVSDINVQKYCVNKFKTWLPKLNMLLDTYHKHQTIMQNVITWCCKTSILDNERKQYSSQLDKAKVMQVIL